MTARTGSRHEPFSQITNRFLPSNRRKLPIFQEKINNYLTAQTGSPNQEVLEFRESPLWLIFKTKKSTLRGRGLGLLLTRI